MSLSSQIEEEFEETFSTPSSSRRRRASVDVFESGTRANGLRHSRERLFLYLDALPGNLSAERIRTRSSREARPGPTTVDEERRQQDGFPL